MVNIYICNSLQDYHTLLSMYPNARWYDGNECERNPNFGMPAAFYVFTKTNSTFMDARGIEVAQLHVDNFPSHYQFAELAPQLNIIDVLRVFLKHHNVYEEFKHLALTSETCRPIASTIASRAIDRCGFDWGDHRTKAYIWVGLEYKWKQLCDNFNISEARIGQYHDELFSKD